MNRLVAVVVPALFGVAALLPPQTTGAPGAIRPGTRVLLDAHNAYPYQGRWTDRMDRALATGLPLAIEQDLVWYDGRSVVSHGEALSGTEPTLDAHFFERVRPLIEAAVRENRRDTWPLITLNLDFKTDEPEHHRAIWAVLGRYEGWLTTAVRTASVHDIASLLVGPILVLTGDAAAQERSFHDAVPLGGRLRLFGATPRNAPALRQTNYRRWSNYAWSAIEPEGQPEASAWTAEDESRLRALVSACHAAGLWIRFYTLNGHDPADSRGGWSPGYNFGSLAAARQRWYAAIRAGVDYVAVDQYEAFAEARDTPTVVLSGTLTRDDYETVLSRDFDVPRGTTRIAVRLDYDGANRTVIDLGLHGPGGFRGWSGGGPQQVWVGEHSASFGYSPGPLEPGRWRVLLGVPNIRQESRTEYSVTVSFGDYTDRPVLRAQAGWYAGDLHAHSGHSDGRTLTAAGSRIKVPPEHVFDAARRAGLDFIALTDHNTAAHWTDVDRLQPVFPDLLLLHGREVTTYRGHMNAFGERRFTDFRLGPSRGLDTLTRQLTADRAFVSINHPDAPDDESCMGCGWNDRDKATLGAVGGVELVNGSDHEGPRSGWRFWTSMLSSGHRVTAIGGSDEHSPDETEDRAIGRPTTVVYAEELSEHGILRGLRLGRAYIRTRGADGPVLTLSAAKGDASAVMGGTIPAGRVTIRADVAGATGQRLEWIHNGMAVDHAAVTADGPLMRHFDGNAGDWISVVIRDAAGPTLLSNPIYVQR